MKSKKFVVERQALENTLKKLEILSVRTRLTISSFSDENAVDSINFDLFYRYYKMLFDFKQDIIKALTNKEDKILIPEPLLNKINSYKNPILQIESEINKYPFTNITLH